MTPVMKNILTLIFFVIFFSWISKADAAVDSEAIFNEVFYGSLPDSALVNFSDVDKCIMRNWQYCEVV